MIEAICAAVLPAPTTDAKSGRIATARRTAGPVCDFVRVQAENDIVLIVVMVCSSNVL
jgi:hypothetical protein